MVFQYPTRKDARADRVKPIIGRPPKQPQEILGLIRGKQPESAEEWRVSVALERFKVNYRYQVSIRGGRLLRGGQLLDFLLYIPNPLPLQVFGNYWHRAQLKNQDRLKLAILKQVFGVEPVVLWGSELETIEEAIDRVREVIGL